MEPQPRSPDVGASVPPTRRRVVIVVLIAIVASIAVERLLGLSPERWVDNEDRKAEQATWRISTSLAVVAVGFLAATLSIGPIRVVRGRRPSVHVPWRRTLGVTAAGLAVCHLLVALTIHGRLLWPWGQFVTGWPSLDQPFVVLQSARGAANWLGLTTATLLAALAVLSRDTWMRRLGAARWKTLQRAAYLVLAAVTVHALLYWHVEQRLLLHRALVLAPIVVAAGLQATATLTHARRRRSGVTARPDGAS